MKLSWNVTLTKGSGASQKFIPNHSDKSVCVFLSDTEAEVHSNLPRMKHIQNVTWCFRKWNWDGLFSANHQRSELWWGEGTLLKSLFLLYVPPTRIINTGGKTRTGSKLNQLTLYQLDYTSHMSKRLVQRRSQTHKAMDAFSAPTHYPWIKTVLLFCFKVSDFIE